MRIDKLINYRKCRTKNLFVVASKQFKLFKRLSCKIIKIETVNAIIGKHEYILSPLIKSYSMGLHYLFVLYNLKLYLFLQFLRKQY